MIFQQEYMLVCAKIITFIFDDGHSHNSFLDTEPSDIANYFKPPFPPPPPIGNNEELNPVHVSEAHITKYPL